MLLWSTSKYYCSITIRAYLVNLSVCPRTLDVKLKEYLQSFQLYFIRFYATETEIIDFHSS
jgi:hypothetical protein